MLSLKRKTNVLILFLDVCSGPRRWVKVFRSRPRTLVHNPDVIHNGLNMGSYVSFVICPE